MFKQYIHQTYIAMSRSLTGEAGGMVRVATKRKSGDSRKARAIKKATSVQDAAS
jgi:hypothetical protein